MSDKETETETKYLTFDLKKKEDKFLAQQLGLFPEQIREIDQTAFDGPQLTKGLIFSSGYDWQDRDMKILVSNINNEDARKLYNRVQNVIASINRENNPEAVRSVSLKIRD